jgi:hypothetical protein
MDNVKWQSPETAPKDGSVFLGDMGWPWVCLVCWNAYQKEWVYPSLQLNIVHGEDDPYFDDEYGSPGELKRWLSSRSIIEKQ